MKCPSCSHDTVALEVRVRYPDLDEDGGPRGEPDHVDAGEYGDRYRSALHVCTNCWDAFQWSELTGKGA